VDPYELLGVSRSADDKEIKLSYLRKARECHPDLHPGDPHATRRFQELSSAYQQIKDAESRRAYANPSYRSDYHEPTQAEAEQIFQTVLDDIQLLKEVVSWTLEEMQMDLADLREAIRNGDQEQAKEILSDYKFLGLAVLSLPFIPFLLTFRTPLLILQAILAIKIRTIVDLAARNPRLSIQWVHRLWQSLIVMARHRRARLLDRRRNRPGSS
jgi:hypothetical protein